MKKYLLFTILLIAYSITNINAQNQQWYASNQIKATGAIFSTAFESDTYQNTYVMGSFVGYVDPDNANIQAKGTNDIFFGKYNDSQIPEWLITLGGNGADGTYKIAAAADGIWVVGVFSGDLYIKGQQIPITSKQNADVFMAKFDFDGNYIDSYHILSASRVDIMSIKIDGNYLIIGGVDRGTGISYTNDLVTKIVPATNGFIFKYNFEGSPIWNRPITITNPLTSKGLIEIIPISEGYFVAGNNSNILTVTSSDASQTMLFSGANDPIVNSSTIQYFYSLRINKDGVFIPNSVNIGKSSKNSSVRAFSYKNQAAYYGGLHISELYFNDEKLNLVYNNDANSDIYLLKVSENEEGAKKQTTSIATSGTDELYNIDEINDALYAAGKLGGTWKFNDIDLSSGMFVSSYTITPDTLLPIGASKGTTGTTTDNQVDGTLFSARDFKLVGRFRNGSITLGNDMYSAGSSYSTYMAKGVIFTCIDSIDGKNITGTDAKAKNGELEIDIRGLLPGSQHSITWSKMGTGALPQFNNMKHITGLDVGEYTVKLSYNDNRSSRTRTFRITAPDAFSIDHIEVTNPACTDPDPLGTITVTASVSGSHEVHYRILQTTDKNNQPVDTESAHTDETDDGIFVDCPPGRYTVTVWLDEAVDLALEQNASVVEEDQTQYVLDITNEGYACNRLNAPGETGSITVSVDENQTLEWYALVDAASGATAVRGRFTAEAPNTHQFNNVAPGTYQVWTGKDACIEKSADISLIEPPAVIINFADAVSETCIGKNDGIINVDVSGVVNVIYYSLYDATETGEKGNSVSGPQTNNYFEDLSPGNYIVTAADGNAPDACTAETSVTVNPGYAVAVALTPGSLHHACAEKNNGQFAVTATGGPTANYSFYRYKADASAGSTPTNASGIFINLEPYEYMVKAVDQVYGCEATLPAPVIVSRLAAVTFDQPVQTQPLCYGESNGKITVNNLSGGMGTYNLTLTKDGAPVATGKVTGSAYEFTGLHAGLYTVAVTDDNTCSGGSKDVEVTQPEVLTVTVGTEDITNVLCFGDRTGAIAAHAAGGTSTGAAPYQFELYQGATLLRGPQPENTFRDLPAGTGYEVKVTDANGCTAHTSSLGIDEPPVIAVSVDERLKDINCKKEDGRITVSASGGWGGFEFSLRDANDDKLTDFSIEPVIPIKAAGSYRVKAKDSKGCLNNSDVIAVRDTSVKSFTYAVKSECNNKDDGTITVSTDETDMKYSLVSFKPEQPSPEFLGLNAGNYKLMLKNQYFCKDSANVTVAATSLEFTVTTANAPRASGTGTATITGVTGGESPYTYSFNNGAAAALSIPQTITGLQPNKLYSLTVADKEGCSTNHPVEVTIATGFEDMDAPSLKIYPNPSDGRFYIEWKTQGDMRVTVEIIGMSGQVVYKGTAQTGAGGVRTYIDMGNHAKGTYILHVPELNIRQRIVIQ